LDVKSILHRANFRQGQEPPKMYIECTSPGNSQRSCKVWLASGERRRCSNEGKTRNRLKFVGVPQTTGLISAASEPKFTILWGQVEKILLFKPDKVVRWHPDGEFLAIFLRPVFQRAACSTFQTCILNSH